MSANKLNQVIAIEKTVKSRAQKELTAAYKLLDKPQLFSGLNKQWRKLDEENGEDRPSENKRVQVKVPDLLESVSETLSELFEITAQKDYANCEARADVVVDGTPLLTRVPVTYLLFLEKQLVDMHTFVSKLPVLDSDEDWTHDSVVNIYKSNPVSTQSTKKVETPIVLYDATDKHPAQTQLITKDVIVGHWETVKMSGAVTESKKKELLRKVEKLQNSVKCARETANEETASSQGVGATVLSYLFG